METANGPFLESAAPADRVRFMLKTTPIARFQGLKVPNSQPVSLRAIGAAEFVLIAISEQEHLRAVQLGGPH